MQTFLVERDLPGISMADLHGLRAAAIRHTAQMRDNGDRIYYLGSTFLPHEGRCLCMFEAKDADVVTALNQMANLPSERVVQALSLGMPVMALG